MRKKIKKVITHPLISGSFLLITGGFLTNFFNFIFNLFMSRNLRIEDYGTFVSLISIITLLTIPAGAVTPTIVSLAGDYFVKSDTKRLNALYHKIIRPLILIGFLLIIFFTFFAKDVGSFFNIKDRFLLSVTGIAILFAYIFTINISFVQAKLSFKFLSSLNISSAICKVLFGILLVLTGYGLGGAVVAYLLSFLIPVIFGIYYLRKVVFYKSKIMTQISYKELVKYGIPSAIVIFCLNSYIATDILLVKHIFSQTNAGLYAGLSLVGRVVFYITAPVSTAMFPLIISRFNSKKPYRNIFFLAMIIVSMISVGSTVIYFMVPKFVLLFFLKKTAYLAVANNLGMFGVFITLYSLVSVLSYYFLSIKKTVIASPLLVGAILQAILIYFNHVNFGMIINMSILIMIGILTYLLIYFKYSSTKI